MSDEESKGNGTSDSSEKDYTPNDKEDVRAIPSGDLIAALFFCLNNEFNLVGQLQMIQTMPPEQLQDLRVQGAFREGQKKLVECKEAREKIVNEFNERFKSTDAMRRALAVGVIEEINFFGKKTP